MSKNRITDANKSLGVHSLQQDQFIADQFASHRRPTDESAMLNARARGEIEPLLEEVSDQIHKLKAAVIDLAGHLQPVLGPDFPMDIPPPGPSSSAIGGALADFSSRITTITAEVEQIKRRSQL